MLGKKEDEIPCSEVHFIYWLDGFIDMQAMNFPKYTVSPF